MRPGSRRRAPPSFRGTRASLRARDDEARRPPSPPRAAPPPPPPPAPRDEPRRRRVGSTAASSSAAVASARAPASEDLVRERHRGRGGEGGVPAPTSRMRSQYPRTPPRRSPPRRLSAAPPPSAVAQRGAGATDASSASASRAAAAVASNLCGRTRGRTPIVRREAAAVPLGALRLDRREAPHLPRGGVARERLEDAAQSRAVAEFAAAAAKGPVVFSASLQRVAQLPAHASARERLGPVASSLTPAPFARLGSAPMTARSRRRRERLRRPKPHRPFRGCRHGEERPVRVRRDRVHVREVAVGHGQARAHDHVPRPNGRVPRTGEAHVRHLRVPRVPAHVLGRPRKTIAGSVGAPVAPSSDHTPSGRVVRHGQQTPRNERGVRDAVALLRVPAVALVEHRVRGATIAQGRAVHVNRPRERPRRDRVRANKSNAQPNTWASCMIRHLTNGAALGVPSRCRSTCTRVNVWSRHANANTRARSGARRRDESPACSPRAKASRVPLSTSNTYSFPSYPPPHTMLPSQDTAQLYSEPFPASYARSPPPNPRPSRRRCRTHWTHFFILASHRRIVPSKLQLNRSSGRERAIEDGLRVPLLARPRLPSRPHVHDRHLPGLERRDDFRRRRRAPRPGAARPKLDTAPWSHLIDSSGFWLLTFHVRITPWRSLLVTNVAGIDAIHRHALQARALLRELHQLRRPRRALTLNRPSTRPERDDPAERRGEQVILARVERHVRDLRVLEHAAQLLALPRVAVPEPDGAVLRTPSRTETRYSGGARKPSMTCLGENTCRDSVASRRSQLVQFRLHHARQLRLQARVPLHASRRTRRTSGAASPRPSRRRTRG